MISQVICDRRPANDKLAMCGPVLADIQWPTDDDIMYSVWKQNKETRCFLLIADVILLSTRLHWSHWFSLTLRMQLVLWLWSQILCRPLLWDGLHFQVLGAQTSASNVPPDMREQVGPLELKKDNLNSKVQWVINTWEKCHFAAVCGSKLLAVKTSIFHQAVADTEVMFSVFLPEIWGSWLLLGHWPVKIKYLQM